MVKIKICLGSSCFARGNDRNVETIEKFLQARGLRDGVEVSLEGCLCLGKCANGPVVMVDDVFYTNVSGGVMTDILNKLFPASAAEVKNEQ